MIEMAAMVKNIKETKPEMNIPGINRATLQELFRVNYQSEKKLAETCNVCHTVVQQKVQILRMPEFVIFSLNRYCSLGQNQLKFQLDLDIPLQDFNIIGQRYDLVTVVTRVKSEPTQLENEGFLIAYNRNIVTNEWHAYSNSLVYKVSFEEIEINRNSLYLIYKYIKSQ
ncbi:hypothetical protein FGO68_gene10264 [Halteria grandinella]|uniref:USP domain-containing protein n=1 Tax=Halteria grandinella TaxID=5974 RepID=A0A8J8P0G7_HALGN|nr:hypothetical protein FGO68_gene10264 [Halteria grandinella]